jgi:hypothetical protein
MSSQNRCGIAQRAQALTLLVTGATYDYITTQTGNSKRQIQYYLTTAKIRGFDPIVSIILKEEYLKDGIRTGRPKKTSLEQEEAIITSIK